MSPSARSLLSSAAKVTTNVHHHGRCSKFSIPLILIGVLTVLITHYSASKRSFPKSTSLNTVLSVDDFVSDSVHSKSFVSSGKKRSSTTIVNDEDNLTHNGVPLHVVFSTSCNEQMHWESYVFFYHAMVVNQPGTVTRIASGCSDKEAAEAQKFFEDSITPMSSRFQLHLTPDFSREKHIGTPNTGYAYKYMNKPFGLKSFLENVLQVNSTDKPTAVEDGVVILMDPDMVLLRPLVHDFRNEDVIWVEEKPLTKVVRHGYPMGQQDGYLNSKWMYLNGSFITGDSNIDRPRDHEGPLHWNSGPPYLATVKDMYEIANLWTVYAPLVDHVNPGLFAEMQGYIWATYKLGLAHTFIKSIVVSTTTTPHREGWEYVDQLKDEDGCRPLRNNTQLPIALHYCSRYALGPDFFFSKYRLKKNFLSCEKNLMARPDKYIQYDFDFFVAPPPANGKEKGKPEKQSFGDKRAKREAFMLCGMIDAVNDAAIYYKNHNCDGQGNFNETYTIRNDPSKY